MAAQPQYIPFPLDIEEVEVQPWIIASFVSFMLFGINLLQFWNVQQRLRKDDEDHTKDMIILGILLIADIADSVGKAAFVTIWLRQIITGGLEAATPLPKIVFAPCFTDGTIACLVHIVYARRLWRIIPKPKSIAHGMVVIIMLISISQFAASIVSGTIAQRPGDKWFPDLFYPAGVWFGGAALADILLCAMMVYYLQRHRSKSAFEGTTNVLTKYIVLSLETAMLPAAMQIVELGLFYGILSNHVHFTIALCEPKIYINGVLILLHTAMSTRSTSHGRFTKGSTSSASRGPGHEMQRTGQTNTVDHTISRPAPPASGIMISSHMDVVDEGTPYQNRQVVLPSQAEGYLDHEYQEKYV